MRALGAEFGSLVGDATASRSPKNGGILFTWLAEDEALYQDVEKKHHFSSLPMIVKLPDGRA